MHKADLEQQELADRYLRGELSEEEAERFEERFLSDPALLDELELTERLRQGLRDVAAIGTAHEPAREPERARSLLRTPQYAVAATALLLVSMTITSLLYHRVDELESRGALTETGNVRLVPLMTVRGAGLLDAGTRIEARADEQLVLLVDAGPVDYSGYRVTLTRAGEADAPVWASADVTRGYQDLLALAVPGFRLRTGAYRLRVEGRRAAAPDGGDYELVTELRFEVDQSP